MPKLSLGLRTEEVQRQLAELAQTLLPQPSSEPPRRSPAVDALLVELRQALSIGDLDLPSSRIRLLERISDELSASVLSNPARKTAARTRLGTRGDLPLSQYRIKFRNEFDIDEARGIRRSHVESALRHPDGVEHLVSIDSEHPIGMTFVAKLIGKIEDSDAFVLLIQAARNEDTLLVLKAWRIYSHDISLPSLMAPVELFERFVEHYGVLFQLGPLGPTKLILNNVFTSDPSQMVRPSVQILDEPPGGTEGILAARESVLGVVYVNTAYAIDCVRYFRDLKRHNAQVSDTYLDLNIRSNSTLSFRDL